MTEPQEAGSERELVYVDDHPKSIYGNLLIDGPDGKCFYFYQGIDERCPNEAVAFTHLHGDRVEMCAEHCPVDVPEPPSTEQQELATDGGEEEWICDRCGEPMERGHPLDAVAHPNESAVCDDCVELWDEVVDV